MIEKCRAQHPTIEEATCDNSDGHLDFHFNDDFAIVWSNLAEININLGE